MFVFVWWFVSVDLVWFADCSGVLICDRLVCCLCFGLRVVIWCGALVCGLVLTCGVCCDCVVVVLVFVWLFIVFLIFGFVFI